MRFEGLSHLRYSVRIAAPRYMLTRESKQLVALRDMRQRFSGLISSSENASLKHRRVTISALFKACRNYSMQNARYAELAVPNWSYI